MTRETASAGERLVRGLSFTTFGLAAIPALIVVADLQIVNGSGLFVGSSFGALATALAAGAVLTALPEDARERVDGLAIVALLVGLLPVIALVVIDRMVFFPS